MILASSAPSFPLGNFRTGKLHAMTRFPARSASLAMLALSLTAIGATTSVAEDAPAAPAAPPPSIANFEGWQSGIKFNAQIEGGVSFATSGPKTNFGQLFTDHPNQAQLNQILLTASRVIDPKQTEWDVGFKFQLMYGSDARYTHYMGEFNHLTHDRYQLNLLEANMSVHAPLLTEGGIDLKFGQFPTPIGFETIDPSGNPFYTHSYIFNFGIPFVHTGAYATVHATDVIDLYGGITTGVNTTFGGGDNNGSAGAPFGFGLNLLEGKLTLLALSHVGPETSYRITPHASHYDRYLNDVTITYKPDDKFAFTTELNYIKDDFGRAEGYGAAQYASYALTDTLTINGRAEVWRDNKGFFVGSFPGQPGQHQRPARPPRDRARRRACHLWRADRRRDLQAQPARPDCGPAAPPRGPLRPRAQRHPRVQQRP